MVVEDGIARLWSCVSQLRSRFQNCHTHNTDIKSYRGVDVGVGQDKIKFSLHLLSLLLLLPNCQYKLLLLHMLYTIQSFDLLLVQLYLITVRGTCVRFTFLNSTFLRNN